MSWTRVDRVQLPTALFVEGREDASRLFAEMIKKPSIILECLVAYGDDWAVLFGAETPEGDIVLPRFPQATFLYQDTEENWLPVGTGLNIPIHVRNDYLTELHKKHDLANQMIITIPKFKKHEIDTSIAHIYKVIDRRPLAHMKSFNGLLS